MTSVKRQFKRGLHKVANTQMHNHTNIVCERIGRFRRILRHCSFECMFITILWFQRSMVMFDRFNFFFFLKRDHIL